MTTDEDYATIAMAAYTADSRWQHPPSAFGAKIPQQNPQFQVVFPPVSDPATGFQGMAVAPLVGGVPDYSRVYVSFAGTNFEHHADISADAQVVIGGETGSATQAAQAVDYAKNAAAEISKHHPEATFSTVGHSLGGFLAMYVAGEHHWPSTTFNGPDAWRSLSPQAKKWYLEQIAAGKNPFRNYVNRLDLVGNINGNESGAARYVNDRAGKGLIDYHNINSGFDFDEGDGSVLGAGAERASLTVIIENQLGGIPPQYRGAAATALAGIAALLRDPTIGPSAGKAISALMVAVDTVAATSLASSIFSTSDLLMNVKSLNAGLIPQMELGLRDAMSAVHAIPSITEADIESCVATHRLRVHQNIDEHAVAAVDRLVEEHLDTVHRLSSGIGTAISNAGEQDAQWANVYAGR